MKKKPKNIPHPYKSKGIPVYRDTTALPFENGGELLAQPYPNSFFASDLGNYYADGGPLHDRDNETGKLLNSTYASALGSMFRDGGYFDRGYSLPEDSFRQGGRGLKDSIYASTSGQYPAPYKYGGSVLSMSNTPQLEGEGKDLNYPSKGYAYAKGGMIKRADGSYSQRGLWDNIRANKGSGKKPTKEMLAQEKKIKANKYDLGGPSIRVAGQRELRNPNALRLEYSPASYNYSDYINSLGYNVSLTKPNLNRSTAENNRLVVPASLKFYQDYTDNAAAYAKDPSRFELEGEYAREIGIPNAPYEKFTRGIRPKEIGIEGRVGLASKLGDTNAEYGPGGEAFADAILGYSQNRGFYAGAEPGVKVHFNKKDPGKSRGKLHGYVGGSFPFTVQTKAPYSVIRTYAPTVSLEELNSGEVIENYEQRVKGGEGAAGRMGPKVSGQLDYTLGKGPLTGLNIGGRASALFDISTGKSVYAHPERMASQAIVHTDSDTDVRGMNTQPYINAELFASYPIGAAAKKAGAAAKNIGEEVAKSSIFDSFTGITTPGLYLNKPEFDSRIKEGGAPIGYLPGSYPNTNKLFTSPEESMQYYNKPFLPTPTGEMGTTSQFETMQNPSFKYGGSFNNPGFKALPTNVQAKIKANSFADGGPMAQLTEFNAGGTHEQNPIGGIPQGMAPNGQVNLVEQGETKLNSEDYIFSDSLKVDKETVNAFGLSKNLIGKTFADASKTLNRPKSRRENDTIEENAIKRDLDNLMGAQEFYKQEQIDNKLQELQSLAPDLYNQMMQGMQSYQPMEMGQGMPGEMTEQEVMMDETGQPVDPNQIPPEMLAQMPEAQAGMPVMAYGGHMYKCGGKMYNFGGQMYNMGGSMYNYGGNMYNYGGRMFEGGGGLSAEEKARLAQGSYLASTGLPTVKEKTAAEKAAEMSGQIGQYAGLAAQGVNAGMTFADKNATAEQKADAAYNTGVGIASAINPVVGGLIGVGDMVGGQLKENVFEKYNDEGELQNENTAKAGAVLGSLFNPFKAITTRSSYEGGWTDFTGDKYVEYLEDQKKKELGITDTTPTYSSQLGAVMNSNYMNQGGYLTPQHRYKANYPTYKDNAGPQGQPLTNLYAAGGGIDINPANKGKFTAKANAAGMGVQEFANKVLNAKEGVYDPSTRRQANFAKNAAGWKHENGGQMHNESLASYDPAAFNMLGMGQHLGQQMYEPLDHIEKYGGRLMAEGGMLGDPPPTQQYFANPEDEYLAEFLATEENKYMPTGNTTPVMPVAPIVTRNDGYRDPADFNTFLAAEEAKYGVTPSVPVATNVSVTAKEVLEQGQDQDELIKLQNDVLNAETQEELDAATAAYQSALKRLDETLKKNEVDMTIQRKLPRDLMMFAPAAYNIGTGLFEKANQLNPANYMVRADLQGTEMNIEPIRRRIQQNYAQALNAVRNAGASGGSYMTNVQQLAAAQNAAASQAEIEKQNADMLSAERANMANKQIESGNIQTKQQIEQLNRQAQAMKRAALTTGLTQVADIAKGAYDLDAQKALAKAISPTFGDKFGVTNYKQLQDLLDARTARQAEKDAKKKETTKTEEK